MPVPVYIPQQYMRDSVSHPLKAFGIVTIFYFRHFDKCVAIIHCVLICISLMVNDAEHLIIYLLTICISYSVKCLFRSFVYFRIILSFFMVGFLEFFFSL